MTRGMSDSTLIGLADLHRIDGWHEEGEGIGVNVNVMYVKVMLIDPLGAKPMRRSPG